MFTLAPGLLPTCIAAEAIPFYADGGGSGAPDAVALPAAMMLYLTSGRASRLSGRFVHFTDDINASESPFFDVMGLVGIAQRSGIWQRLSGIGRT